MRVISWKFLAGVTLIVAAFLIAATDWRSRSTVAVIEAFAQSHGLHGGVVAIGAAGREPELVAFGYADADHTRPMAPDDRLKIASLSKPVTAAATLTLIDQGAFTLETRLVDLVPAAQGALDPRYGDITVRHLLQHSAGWDRTKSFDPFSMRDPAIAEEARDRSARENSCDAIADAMMALPLQFDPGEKFVYSNLGYCWLGRIVAKVGGASYDDVVRRLLPVAGTFTFDESTLTVRPSIDAAESDDWLHDPYVIGAAGGWITDARSYHAFASAPIHPLTTERPDYATRSDYYALGWRVWNLPQGRVLRHYGSMSGVFSLVVRKVDGPVLVALFNGRPSNPDLAVAGLFDALMRLPDWGG